MRDRREFQFGQIATALEGLTHMGMTEHVPGWLSRVWWAVARHEPAVSWATR